jgi:ATP-dependent RNA helicase DeaD
MSEVETNIAGFAELGLRSELLEALTQLGYEEPTPIQQQAMPPMLEGRDVLGQAATGTGKTAAFALPLLHRLAPSSERSDHPTALVLVPTRELAVQVCEAVHRYGRHLGARVAPVYGGQPIGRQIQSLTRGVDVVVATPGRALDHLGRGTLDLSEVEVVVLDEADEMLDMGFAEDLEAILGATSTDRQTVLFSATMPARIDGIARRHLRQPVRVDVARDVPAPGETPRVRQVAYVVARAHKDAALGRVLDVESPTAALVFCRTRTEVDQLTETLNGRGYRAEALHGGMSQEARDRVMGRLRSGTAELLVATDVAARGLDIDVLSHVVNFDVPSSPETYVHRTGRVGRAGREGVAVTLVEPRQHRLLHNIERVTGQKVAVEKLPSVADVQARRLELVADALRERVGEGDLERFTVVVDQLADEVDLLDLALAAIALAHDAAGPADDDTEIPEASAPRRRDDGRRGGTPGPQRAWREREQAAGRGRERDAGRGGGRRRDSDRSTTRLFVGLGRDGGVRPQDLVGAITGETPLSGRDIGAIEISDRFSLVEVPESAADEVVASLRGASIKGRRVNIRRERFDRR